VRKFGEDRTKVNSILRQKRPQIQFRSIKWA